MQEHLGGCHCGNLQVRVLLTLSPDAVQLRACQCTFCRAHGALSISDPSGKAVIDCENVEEVVRYRFGKRITDFYICKRCGVYVGAVSETPAGLKCVINVNALQNRDGFTRASEPMEYGAENAGQRIDRRSERWMPVDVRF